MKLPPGGSPLLFNVFVGNNEMELTRNIRFRIQSNKQLLI